MNNTFGFIGVGNMGSAIVSGMLLSKHFKEENIFLCDLSVPESFKNCNINITDIPTLTVKSDYIILCVKPNCIKNVLEEIKAVNGYDKKVFVSIAAGVKIADIQSVLGDVKVVRTMPNLPLKVSGGMTAMCRDKSVSDTEFAFAESIFACSGKCTEVDEKLINACTAINGSGPAYAFMFIEALADAGVKLGLKRDDAYLLASQTLLGSAKMQLETGLHPGVLKDMVCSPGGTTIDAVASLENDGFRNAVINAVEACAKKAEKLN